jgi:hypothetical protein
MLRTLDVRTLAIAGGSCSARRSQCPRVAAALRDVRPALGTHRGARLRLLRAPRALAGARCTIFIAAGNRRRGRLPRARMRGRCSALRAHADVRREPARLRREDDFARGNDAKARRSASRSRRNASRLRRRSELARAVLERSALPDSARSARRIGRGLRSGLATMSNSSGAAAARRRSFRLRQSGLDYGIGSRAMPR